MPIYAQKGSKSNNVKKIQEKINAFFGDVRQPDGKMGKKLNPDSDFGSKTEQAVKDYQFDQGLISDGIVGNFTWHILMESTYGLVLSRPKMVSQGSSQKCWAATTESWLNAHAGKINEKMNDIVSDGQTAGKVTSSGGLKIGAGETWWLDTYGLKANSVSASNFFAEKANSRLRKYRKPLPLGLRSSAGGEGHVTLMYGVQAKSGELIIHTMEPFRARYFELKVLDVQVISGVVKTWAPKV